MACCVWHVHDRLYSRLVQPVVCTTLHSTAVRYTFSEQWGILLHQGHVLHNKHCPLVSAANADNYSC